MTEFSRNGISIGIGHFQNHKKPCLYVLIGTHATKVATFSDDTSAHWFKEIVEEFLDGMLIKDAKENGDG